MVQIAGVTAIDTRAAGVTVNNALPETSPNVAITLTVLTAKPVASPAVFGVLLMVAIVPSAVLQ